MEAMTRSTHLVARYGGEEFGCILPETERAEALEIGENLRRAVLDLRISHALSDIDQSVTLSLGAATQPAGQPAENAKALVRAADDNLYRAKAQGRNRLVA